MGPVRHRYSFSRSAECSKSAYPPETNLSSCSDNNLSVQGWALKGQKTSTKTSKKVKEFLIAKFNEGLLSGKKANPFDVSMEMQDAKDPKGLALSSPEEWKTSRQISSFFFPDYLHCRKARWLIQLQ